MSPSEKVSVVDLSSSSDEEGLIADVSWDEEFTKRLFGDLMKKIISDGKIIMLNDSDEEVCEEKITSTEDTATSVVVNPASTTSIDADDAPLGVKTIIVMIAPSGSRDEKKFIVPKFRGETCPTRFCCTKFYQ
jgi:hypothetical protein